MNEFDNDCWVSFKGVYTLRVAVNADDRQGWRMTEEIRKNLACILRKLGFGQLARGKSFGGCAQTPAVAISGPDIKGRPICKPWRSFRRRDALSPYFPSKTHCLLRFLIAPENSIAELSRCSLES